MKEPWTIPNSPWKDEKAYLNWLRGSIRRIWSRHPVKISYKQDRRYKAPIGKDGKEVWVSDCEICGKQSRDCQVDHLHGGYGFTDWDSFTEWAKMILWVGFDDIQELCIPCHETTTLSQRKNISFEEAKRKKEIIALLKQPVEAQRAFLEERGYSPIPKTKKGLKEAIEKVIEEAR